MIVTPDMQTSFPPMVVAALTNVCTHACIHCPQRHYSQKKDFNPHYMSCDCIENIVDEMAHYPHSLLRFCAWGEPCLHPNLTDFVAYAHSRNVKTILLTNGYLLNEQLSQALLNAGLTLIEVSIDAASSETYTAVRCCNDPAAFTKVVDNVESMIQLRNAVLSSTSIVVSHVTWPNEAGEMEFREFESSWDGKADEVVKRRLTSFCGTLDSESVAVPENRVPCYGLWARFNVNPWGKVPICYNQWEKDKWIIGDLNEPQSTITSIWTGEQFNQLRKQQKKGIYTGPCENCTDYNPFAWEHPFEEVVWKVEQNKKCKFS
ncbi:MAG: radical SAM protein [Chitinivibrionales bacterium]|nr:radical SAM protein [Chitinivibrionales bacterium]